MIRGIKRLAAFMLAMVMMLSMSMVAAAEDGGDGIPEVKEFAIDADSIIKSQEVAYKGQTLTISFEIDKDKTKVELPETAVINFDIWADYQNDSVPMIFKRDKAGVYRGSAVIEDRVNMVDDEAFSDLNTIVFYNYNEKGQISEVYILPRDYAGPYSTEGELLEDMSEGASLLGLLEDDATKIYIADPQILDDFEFIYVPKKLPYTDVPADSWFLKYATEAHYYELMTGLAGTTQFAPYQTLPRAQVVQVLYNIAGKPEVTYDGKFKDVTDKDWFAPAVQWAYDTGITVGYEAEGKFKPYQAVTRQELAIFMSNFAEKLAGMDVTPKGNLDKFSDAAKVSSFAKNQVIWATDNGIITGNNGEIKPLDGTVRAEAAAMFVRFYNILP